eukprot:Hpha_TRINITY_DN15249_c3_g3::TRINITY_DN15249_c3_g3_i1::g.64999::m.64999
MAPKRGPGRAKRRRVGDFSTEQQLGAFIEEKMRSVEVIDVHTHLFPPSHGDLMLWGIDELLTYHYLVSEFFMVAPSSLTHAAFFAKPKAEQAALVWEYLFVQRLPVSEAQRGVVTTLQRLGLGELVEKKDLEGVRKWFSEQDPEEHVERVFNLAGVKYVVMTNIPFDPREAQRFLDDRPTHPRFKAALRIDPVLKGDWGTIKAAVAERGMSEDMAGAREYLKWWAKKMDAIYLMASTPADFCYGPGDKPREEGWPTATELIDQVMVPVARELKLPLALKLGAHRNMAPDLSPCGGGDGVVVADVSPLRALVAGNPDLKFLATFLSRVNQHEVAVLTQKFRNLHVYGCWWFCNNPSIIEDITRMRIELLGTAFTSQHSDCRVIEQLLYKWIHSREALFPAIRDQFANLFRAGWVLTEEEVSRDIYRLLGGSYEEFMSK